MKTRQRCFGGMTIAVLALMFACAFPGAARAQNPVKFISPIDRGMLCAYDGKVVNGALLTTVAVSAPSGSRIKINGMEAKQAGNTFTAEIRLKDYRNQIELLDAKTGDRQTITVFWLKNYLN